MYVVRTSLLTDGAANLTLPPSRGAWVDKSFIIRIQTKGEDR